jgi:cytidylate kinase
MQGGDQTDEDSAAEAAAAVQEEDLLNPKLRAENIGKIASYVSAMPKVRAALLEWQRNFARRTGGAILDGRDIGTVVCPSAEAKLFITASQPARAHRRWLELSGMGVDVSEESVLREIEIRDARDSERAAAPLKPAEGAMVIDTTDIDPNDVFQQALEYIADLINNSTFVA